MPMLPYNIVKRPCCAVSRSCRAARRCLAKHLPRADSRFRKPRNVGCSMTLRRAADPRDPQPREYYDNDLLLEVKGILNGLRRTSHPRAARPAGDLGYANVPRAGAGAGFAESDPPRLTSRAELIDCHVGDHHCMRWEPMSPPSASFTLRHLDDPRFGHSVRP